MSLSISESLRKAPATSQELQRATRLSQPAVSRQLRAMGDSVVRWKEGRTVRYAITRNAFGADDKLSLYMVDPLGNNVVVARVRPLSHGGFFVEPYAGMPPLLLGEGRKGLYDDLPYFLEDLRPQGFLGRQIAHQIASNSADFPEDPRYWNTEQIGRYLISNGDDLPGNFKFGPMAHLRVGHSPVPVDCEDYPALADRVMRGIIPGSSAGGEQPKFTAYNAERGHVIVKFSPREEGAVARRWRDILLTEFHAMEAIHAAGFPAADTRLIQGDGRLFLESVRFDRSGEFGRMPLVSLQAVDAEFSRLGSNWPAVMKALAGIGLVNPQQVHDAVVLWGFGRLIHNTDMHLGNLSLCFDGAVFRLLPIYDMCSMGFAPKGGETLPFAFSPPKISLGPGLAEESIATAMEMARRFWRAVAGDKRASGELRGFVTASGLA